MLTAKIKAGSGAVRLARERIEGPFEQQAAARFTLAVQNMPCGGDGMPAAEIRFQQVASDETEAVGNA